MEIIVDEFPDREITLNGEKYLYFGGTSYLGMATNKEFQEIIYENLKKWGTFYGSSRNANVKLAIYDKFESYFSEYLGAETALTISSGTLAGKMVVDYLAKSKVVFFHYPKTHPAILAPNSLPLFINDKLHPKLRDAIFEDIVITTDAILPLETTSTSFDFLDKISSQKKITLVLDESHSLGVIGVLGEGIFSKIKSKKLHRKIMIASLGKALGLSGGIIAADKEFIDNIRAEPVFVSSSGANPTYLEAYMSGFQLYEKQRKLLIQNLNFLGKILVPKQAFQFNKSYPVIYSNSDDIYKALLIKKIVIARFKYPTYENYMNRIVITANHTKADLEKLASVLNASEI
ncbi:MAG: aminotransferase class I/II [Flavobacteriales bacterium CG_4_10_14_0_2_um_filter_35_18]|nr:aminotransferase class I/II-fold pyridoxal phosphate-dependent enzyme [Bacteroidota bacterium]NCT16806.1 aminotransferase class I/II-fold pyridoxal phosphate-dependent enzyme [Flavobacteriia bacterium]PJA05286.1 MAG: aminotransferase class I/II [Flavobacteriales bacterium CG_4_10_14_0_2_um_filter_35_18]